MKSVQTSLLAIGMLLFCPLAFGQKVEMNNIVLTVTGLEPRVGQVVVALFDESETFLKESSFTKTISVDENKKITFEIPAKIQGEYAISVYYDRNNDDQLNTNWIGIPVEPVGFSNNATGLIGPPSFKDASFIHNGVQAITVNLKKVKR